MYRAMTLKVLQQNISLDQTETIGRLAKRTQIRLDQSDGELKVFLDNRDVTQAIRNQAVTRAVSTVSMIKKVREVMVREQRRMGKRGGIVLEGRDIGTVVFPNADLKIFMVAHVEERARRRQKELKKQGVKVSVEQLVKELVERDRKDSKRDISPLQKAEDAVILDTSKMTLVGQADFVVQKVQEILKKR